PDEPLPCLHLPVRGDGILEVAEQDVALPGEVGDLRRHLRIGRIEEVDHPGGLERDFPDGDRGPDGEGPEEISRAAHGRENCFPPPVFNPRASMMAGSPRVARPDHRIAFAALMLTVAAVFWRHLLTADVLFYRDISYIHFARAVELRTIVRSGSVPLWNPFEHFGEPVAANPNYLLFYPTTWLAWILPVTYGFKLHYLLHFFALAAGSFLLAQRVGLGPLACYAAGALFVFSGPVMSLGNFANFLPAAAWMPFAILATDRLMRRGGVGAAALCGGCFAVQIFAGEPLTSITTAFLALGWSLTFHGDRRLLGRANRLVLGRLLRSLALAAGFAAVQVLPAVSHARPPERPQFAYHHSLGLSPPPIPAPHG